MNYSETVNNFVDPIGLDPNNTVMRCHANYQPQPQVKKEPDYCGSGFTEPWVPDIPFGVDLRPACEKHDKCYGEEGAKAGTPRWKCDFDLKNDAWEACLKKYPNNPAACDGLGLTYYMGVRFGGGLSFYFGRKP